MKRITVLLMSVFLLSACSGDDATVFDDAALVGLAESHGMDGDPLNGRTPPDIRDPLAQLGRDLFFSKALSGDLDTACASCHHPMLGGGDALSLPVGVHAEIPDLLGPGRFHSGSLAGAAGMAFDGGPTVPRNSPTTFNVALWERVLFHDGRVERLPDGGIRTPDTGYGIADPRISGASLVDAQARFPVTSPEEMRAHFAAGQHNDQVREALVGRLVSQTLPNTWLESFQRAFQSTADAANLITVDNIAIAIAAYEESQVFVDTPWTRYLSGDRDAISTAAKRGAELFLRPISEGGAQCASCHAGDSFSDERFHVIAMPQIGRGKEDGLTGDDDFGRFRETGEPEDRYAFRTPSLINVAVTGPYGHAGAYESLEETVRHHLDPAEALRNYDFTLGQLRQSAVQSLNARTNTLFALEQWETLRSSGSSLLQPVQLSDEQVADLLEFLHALTDPCVLDRDCLAPWIPSDDSVDPDHLRLHAVDVAGWTL